MTPTTRLHEELLAAYRSPARGYHDERHLDEVLQRLEELGNTDEAVVWAAWFHDAVYEGRPDDEERSAQWAEQALAEQPTLAREVGRLVRLTRDHRPAPDDRAGALLCDADLAILAAETQRYADYVAGVRQEHSHVPEPDFRAGRAAILSDLLAKPYLFETARARELWEASARANLSRELEELS